jgi:hypothetical protein
MIEPLQWAAQAPLGVLVGIAAGGVHFATLHRNVRLLARGRLAHALALQCARLGGLLLVLFLLTKLGPWALLGGALGVLIARSIVLHRVRRQLP